MANNEFKTICMAEEFWANSHFSIARYYGRIKVGGHEYIIVNKEGKDLFELSIEAEKAGRDKAIEPGEPADLCRQDFVPLYRKLGRDRFIAILEANQHISDEELKKIMQRDISTQNKRVNNENRTHRR